MDTTKCENACGEDIEIGRKKRIELDKHNQRRREKRQGIYNLTSWHVSRLRSMEENPIDNYKTFTTFIKWKGGIPPNENKFQEENDYLSELKDVFDSYNGYYFFKKHGLMLPPVGISEPGSYLDDD